MRNTKPKASTHARLKRLACVCMAVHKKVIVVRFTDVEQCPTPLHISKGSRSIHLLQPSVWKRDLHVSATQTKVLSPGWRRPLKPLASKCRIVGDRARRGIVRESREYKQNDHLSLCALMASQLIEDKQHFIKAGKCHAVEMEFNSKKRWFHKREERIMGYPYDSSWVIC